MTEFLEIVSRTFHDVTDTLKQKVAIILLLFVDGWSKAQLKKNKAITKIEHTGICALLWTVNGMNEFSSNGELFSV